MTFLNFQLLEEIKLGEKRKQEWDFERGIVSIVVTMHLESDHISLNFKGFINSSNIPFTNLS